jgi:hypothetical protein
VQEQPELVGGGLGGRPMSEMIRSNRCVL